MTECFQHVVNISIVSMTESRVKSCVHIIQLVMQGDRASQCNPKIRYHDH